MKQTLKKILFAAIICFGASLTTFAQRQDKPPKKDPPIVVVPDRKPTPKDDKKDDDKDKKPKKPAMAGLSAIQFVEVLD
jgi:hypothetical protein